MRYPGQHAHLPRLRLEWYRGRAAVLWTPGIAQRATGWLDEAFHASWRLALTHACARYALVSPAYVLMPDDLHVLWIGLDDDASDQRLAMEFLRKQLRAALTPAEWQHQPHDRVLREKERECGALQSAAGYVLANPERAKLTPDWRGYPFLGCCAVGYPELDPRRDDYWERFWRVHNYLVR